MDALPDERPGHSTGAIVGGNGSPVGRIGIFGQHRDIDRALWERDDLETLQLLADGHTVSQIAKQLHVSDRTVRRSMERMRTKIRATSNQEAIVKARRQGLIV